MVSASLTIEILMALLRVRDILSISATNLRAVSKERCILASI